MGRKYYCNWTGQNLRAALADSVKYAEKPQHKRAALAVASCCRSSLRLREIAERVPVGPVIPENVQQVALSGSTGAVLCRALRLAAWDCLDADECSGDCERGCSVPQRLAYAVQACRVAAEGSARFLDDWCRKRGAIIDAEELAKYYKLTPEKEPEKFRHLT